MTMDGSVPWLTDTEIDELCAGLSQPAAKVRYLRGLGLTVQVKPNGRPLVMRAHAEAVLSGAPPVQVAAANTPTRQPDRQALMLAFGRRAA